jgi:hypothetical protein
MKLPPQIIIVLFTLLATGCHNPTAKTPNGSANDSSPTPTESSRQTNEECDPNYSGCVPIASDVDCAGGKGNGPAYVKGPVRVIGRDIYGLDRDHNGVACE